VSDDGADLARVTQHDHLREAIGGRGELCQGYLVSLVDYEHVVF
jgi:hypothetical protein